MNDTLFQDDFTKTFDVPEIFLQFLEHVEDNAEWRRIKTQDLCLCPLVDPSAPELSTEIFEDTLHNTGLLVKLDDDHAFPLRICAIKSLQDRTKISGPALRKVKPDKLSQIFNFCLEVSKGLTLVRITCGKVSALLSGDPGDYAILDIANLFLLTNNYLNNNYNGQFISGSYEHHFTTAFWTLNHPQLITAYREALVDHGLTPGTLAAAVRFSSSDVGISGANLYPYLTHDGHMIALGTPLKLEHKRSATIADFRNHLDMLFTHYTDSVKALVKLLSIPIDYPAQTMIHVSKNLRLPRKLCMPIIEEFISRTNNSPCTAHECYYQLNEVIFQEQCQGVTPSKLMNTTEVLLRALNLKWSDFDYYSDIVW